MPLLTNPPNPPPLGLVPTIEAQGHSVTQAPEGWFVDNVAAVQAIINGYSGSTGELQWHQAQKLAALGAEYQSKIAAGRIYTVPADPSGAHTYQIDPQSQFDIDAKALKADLALRGIYTWPANFYWVAADNTHVTMTAQQMRDFANDTDGYVTNLFFNYQSLKAQIGAATTPAVVDAIDVTAGWPSNP